MQQVNYQQTLTTEQVFVQQPSPLMTFNVPSVQPIPFLMQPAPMITTIPTIPMLTVVNCPQVYFYNDNQCRLIDPMASGLLNEQGFIVPAEGYSFVDYNLFQQMFGQTLEDVSDSGSVVSSSRSVTPVPEEPVVVKKNPKQPKYAHRSKQKRIDQVHADVVDYYTKLNLHVGDKEVLRGNDTVRIHVKTFHGLNEIKGVLEEVRATVDISKMSTPISMKNKFQKKGFIVYLKLADEAFVPTVQSIFAKYSEHFKKCEVAKAAEHHRTAEDKQAPVILPPGLQRQSSTGFIAA
jgi:hypothetical protein